MDRRLFIGAAAFGLAASLARPGLADAPVVTAEPDDMVMGSPKARVTVIEYASASCPHCARFNNEVFPAFKAKYVDTGRVLYVFREFLTEPASLAAAAFLTARCAGKGRYFGVVDAFFHAQADIYATGELKSHLLKIAADAGMTPAQVDACLSDPKTEQALNDRVKRYADRDGVDSTPTFLVGGQKLIGEQSLAALDKAITAAESAMRPIRRHRHHRAHG
jgi:protein-disulfide isomerase